MGHLDEDALLGFVQHALSPEALAQAEAHLRSCSLCRRAVALLAETEAGPPDPTPLPPRPMHSGRPAFGARPARKGKQIDRYVVLEVLGAGSMGIVYAAFDPQLDRKIALKMLAGASGDHEADAEKRARMMREAQAMARLSHPNVVHVHDVGTFQDQIFVAMEFVQGQSLHKWMESEKRTWRDTLRVFIRAGRGLAAAHAAGLVHRDFKPDNVMVGNDGVARVMDFGLVSAPASGPSAWSTPPPMPAVRGGASPSEADLGKPITRTGALLGTPAYMAPEQWTGGKIDHRADQFSFCVSLYEALYGQRPFEARTLSELVARVGQGKIRDVPPGSPVPFYIRRAVVRGLAADPKLRHPSMQELLAVLELGLRVPRRRVLFASGAAALLVVGGALSGPALWRMRSKEKCGGAADAFAAAWSRPRPPVLPERAQRLIDRFRERWVAARERVCRAADPTTKLREACLDGHLDELRALVEVLGKVNVKMVRSAAMAAASLPSPEVCAEERGLAADIAIEPAGVDRALRHQLALARATLAAGDAVGTRTLAVGVLDAGSGSSAALRAEAWLLLGATATGDDAQRSFGKAMASAEESGHLHAGAEAAVATAELLGAGPQAEFYLNMSSAGLDRLGADGPLRARVELATARRLLAEHRPEAAEASAKHALDILRRLHGDDHPAVSRAMEVQAQVEALRERLPEALGHQRAAVESLERALGPDDPALASALLAMSNAERAVGEAEAAAAHCQRAVALGAAADCAALGRGAPRNKP